MISNKILKILLIVFVIATLILTTVVTIFYANGGLITPEGVIKDTGSLKIEINPDNVPFSLYINEEKKDLLDRRVNNLLEGEYTIKIEAINYTTWEKKVAIHKGQVSDILVKLYPTNLSLTQITKSTVDKLFFSKEGNFIYYAVDNTEIESEKGLWKLPIDQNGLFFNLTPSTPSKIANLEPEIIDAVKNQHYNLLPSPDNTKILFFDLTHNFTYILNSNETNKAPFTSIEKLLGFIPDTVDWYTNSDLLISKDKILSDYNLNNNVNTLLIYRPEQDIIYTTNGFKTIIFDNNTKTLNLYANQKLTPINLHSIVLPTDIEFIKLADIDKNILFLKSKSLGYLYFNIDKLYLKQIFDINNMDMDLTLINHAGTSALFKNKNNDYFSFIATENPASNLIETKLIKLAKSELNEGQYRYSPQSNHIILYNKSQHSIQVMESDGSNLTTLFSDSELGLDANFNANGDSLYLNLKNNIYKIKLAQT